MLKYLFSFIWKQEEPNISLEDAYNILHVNDVKTEISTTYKNIESLSSYDIVTKTGVITKVGEDFLIIDNKYSYENNSPIFYVGSKVSYNLYASKGEVKVTEVTLLENDWDVSIEKKSGWCSRTLVCKVDKKEGRMLSLNPGLISIDLNNVSSEFIPVEGDWVQLDVNSEIDENVVNLSGKILEIKKMYPLRPQIQLCIVSQWNNDSNKGILDNKIFFNKECLSGGYMPIKGDKVIAEIIESNQGRCAWRALKIVPDFIKSINSKTIFENLDLNLTLDGILVEPPESVCIKELNKESKFLVLVHNITNENVILEEVTFPRENSQCSLVNNCITTKLTSYETLNLECCCRSKSMGYSKEYILLKFNKGNIGSWININVGLNNENSSNNYYCKKLSYKQKDFTDVLKGQKCYIPSRFIGGKFSSYDIPTKLINIVTKYDYKDNPIMYDELTTVKPCLLNNLNFMNYLDRFHTLIHLEEIKELIDISTYDQDIACFIQNGEYLMLEIPNLSERRPSLIVGDKIIASDSFETQKTAFEGFIHKVGAKHVYLKFSPLFHDKYNGEDYSIHVVASRTLIRRYHHAIDLATKNLGSSFLFPSKVVEKNSQVLFEEKNDAHLSSKMKALKKLNRRRKSFEENNESKIILSLEWYNNSLNHYQKEAVRNILYGRARPLPYIIFGPPGTGKTITVVETILQILRLIPSSRLLVTTPSNSAADLLALRLISSKVLKPGDLVRLVSNNYATNSLIPPILAPYCVTADISSKDSEVREAFVTDQGFIIGANSSVLGRHRITISTCSSAGLLYQMNFPKGHFTHVIVDEAGQATEPEIMIPLVFLDVSGQAILAGDHMQLGPVVTSKLALELGYGESFMERILNRFPYVRDPEGFPKTGGFDPRLVTKLLYNYRSLPSLLNLTSSLFYNNDLIPTIQETGSKESNLLAQLGEIVGVNKITGKLFSIIFHSIIGENYQTPDSPSWYNPSEVGQILFYINELYRLGLSAKDVAVISPYVKQVKEIRAILSEAEFEIPKIGSIEELQGQEYNVVILSTVRSSKEFVVSDIKQNLGFISAPRRLNVAISRAKVLLIIVGNSDLLYTDKYWQTIIDYIISNGGYIGYSLEDFK